MSSKENRVLNVIRKYSKDVNKEITQNDSKNIIAYCRVSDSKQIDNYSPEVQLNNMKRFSKDEDLKIVKTLKVLGESSKRGSKRPSIDELLEFINTTKYKIHAIVVFHSNRFTRDGDFGAEFLNKIRPKGIGFIDLNDPNDIFTDMGLIRQKNAFYDAEQDNVTRKKFINAITLEKLKQGYTMRRPPRGYQLFKTNKGKNKDQRIIITKEGELIKQAFRMKLDYNYSNVMISEIMKTRGLKITNKALGEIFKNVYYCGFIKDTRLIEHDGYVQGRHPVMISPEEFEMLNYHKKRSRCIRKNDIKELPLRKHLICSACNSKLTGYKASNRNNLFYYKCRTNGCGLNIRSEQVHKLYTDLLNTFSFNRNYLPQLKDLIDEVFKMTNKANTDLKKQLTTIIAELEKDRFLAIKNMNNYPDEKHLFKELIEDCDDRLINLKEQIEEIRFTTSETKENTFKVLDFVNNVSSIWLESDFKFRLKLQALVFPDGIWYNKSSNKLVAPKVNPIFHIVKDLHSEIRKDSQKYYIKNPEKGNENLDENKIKSRTSKILNNMLVTPSIIGGYEHHLKVLGQGKIPLEVLLSSGSNINMSSTSDEIGDSVNYFNNDLIDSMNCLVEVIELYKLMNDNIIKK